MKDKDTKLLEEVYSKVLEEMPSIIWVALFNSSDGQEAWTTQGGTEKEAMNNLLKHFQQIGKDTSLSDIKIARYNNPVEPFKKVR